jgi:hypothetical protein
MPKINGYLPVWFMILLAFGWSCSFEESVNDAGLPDADAGTPDGGAADDSGCQDPIALGATVTALSQPVACTGGNACSWQDLEISYQTCDGQVEGFRFRLILPDSPVDPTPVYMDFPGTGTCHTGLDSPPGNLMGYADLGVAVAALSLRGHCNCYLEGDALYRASTWGGPAEMQDYDRLLWAFLEGQVDPELPAADPERLGFGGVSHGGITSFIYGRKSRIPARTGHPFALSIPSGGAPDSLDWFNAGLDPIEVESLQVTAWGSVRLSGWPGQLWSYAGDYLEHLADLVAAGDLSEFSTQLEEGMYRSGFDGDDDTTSYRNNVQASLITMCSQDCIIPKSGAFRFFQSLREAGGTLDRLISPLGYHSCSGPEQGYQPFYSPEVQARVRAWKNEVRTRGVRRFLLGDQSVDLENWPAWMFMLADEGDEQGEIPVVYGMPAPDELEATTKTYFLDAREALSPDPAPSGVMQLAHDPGNCLTVELAGPCADVDELAYLLLDSAPLEEDLLVIGNPRLTVYAREASGADYAFTAILAEVPDPAKPAEFWPVTSERRFATVDTGEVRTHEVELDKVVHRFKSGSAVRLILTNLSLPITGCLMFAPSTNAYHLTFLTEHQGEQARLELPVVFEGLQSAADTWQIE